MYNIIFLFLLINIILYSIIMGCCFSNLNDKPKHSNQHTPLVNNTPNDLIYNYNTYHYIYDNEYIQKYFRTYPNIINKTEFKLFCKNNFPLIQTLYKKYEHPKFIFSDPALYNPIHHKDYEFIIRNIDHIYRIFVWKDIIVYTTLFEDQTEYVFYIIYVNDE